MIRPALQDDGKSVIGITAESGVFKPVEIDCVEELWNEYIEKGTDSGYEFMVFCREEGQVVGYVCFGPHPLTEGTFDLYWIAVHPKNRERGVGRALLAQVEERVRVASGRLLLIETSGTPPYAPARHLYESAGYEREATIHDFYAPGDDLIVFSKRFVSFGSGRQSGSE